MIRRSGHFLRGALLGTHVGRRSHGHAGHGEPLRLQDLRDPEIGDDRPSFFVQHDVRGLDVTVNYAMAMRVTERIADLRENRLRHRDWQRTDVADDDVEWPSLDVLHDEVQDLIALADGVDRDDVRVAQRRSGARFALEPLDHSFSHEQQCRRQHFDRDLAVQRQIVAEIYRCHAAMPELEQDLVLAERGPPQRFELGVRDARHPFRVNRGCRQCGRR